MAYESQSSPSQAAAPLPDWHIIVDQFGYRPGDDKVAVIADPQAGFNADDHFTPGKTYQVIERETGKAVFTGEAVQWNNGLTDPFAGDRAWWFDFSPLADEGKYYILDVEKNVKSYDFTVSERVYEKVMYHALRMFYYNREGIAHEEPCAEYPWLDGAAWVGQGQDREARDVLDPDNGERIRDISGGWADAGDTNKYITFVDGVVNELLTVYEEKPGFFDRFTLNIPETGNGAPDILNEVKWEMDWLLKMSNDDGSQYIKCGMKSGPGSDATSPPSKDTSPRYYLGRKSSAAAISACTMFAHGAVVFKRIPLYREYGDLLEIKAKKAWEWYMGRLADGTRSEKVDNGEIRSGRANRTLADQDMMAAATAVYLYALTGDEAYHGYFRENYRKVPPFACDASDHHHQGMMSDLVVGGLSMLYYLGIPGGDAAIKDDIRSVYVKRANAPDIQTPYAFDPKASAYRAHASEGLYCWGGNCNRAYVAYDIYDLGALGLIPEKSADFKKRAVNQLHFFHGVNPFNMTFLTNMYRAGASKSCEYMYHEWYQNNGENPDVNRAAPGYLVGGPNIRQDTAVSPPLGQPHMKSYLDAPHNQNGYVRSYAYTEPMCAYQGAYVMLLSKFIGGDSGLAPGLQNEL